jgi:hypothetical protein
MRTTTKRVLSTIYFLPMLFISTAGMLVGLLYVGLRYGFNAALVMDRQLQELWDPKNNDPEYRQ